MSYDIIGDIHGHAEALTALLRKLGYRERSGCWRHPDRTAIFVGDFIDRGPGQLDTVTIVRSMVETGSALAVMGNHEFNAIAWNTPDPQCPGEYLRRHNANRQQEHAAFLG
ncbi:MAG: metallophosphoesterase, partial [Gemmatimonadaceae bacterium]